MPLNFPILDNFEELKYSFSSLPKRIENFLVLSVISDTAAFKSIDSLEN